MDKNQIAQGIAEEFISAIHAASDAGELGRESLETAAEGAQWVLARMAFKLGVADEVSTLVSKRMGMSWFLGEESEYRNWKDDFLS